ncbi:MAG: DUF4112 domain-containing protein [Planctomycetota bacterium]
MTKHTVRSSALPESTRRVIGLARLLDSRFRIPGTGIRFGLDPLIGLVPVVGDTITAVLGATLVVEAVRQRAGAGVIARMVSNLALDWLVGLIPGLDLIADTVVRSNVRNARLLRRAVRDGRGERG